MLEEQHGVDVMSNQIGEDDDCSGCNAKGRVWYMYCVLDSDVDDEINEISLGCMANQI